MLLRIRKQDHDSIGAYLVFRRQVGFHFSTSFGRSADSSILTIKQARSPEFSRITATRRLKIAVSSIRAHKPRHSRMLRSHAAIGSRNYRAGTVAGSDASEFVEESGRVGERMSAFRGEKQHDSQQSQSDGGPTHRGNNSSSAKKLCNFCRTRVF